MENKQTQSEIVSREIDFQALLKSFLRYKWLVLALTAGAALAALVISSTAPKIYRVNTAMQIGTVVNIDGSVQMIEDTASLKDKFDNDIYGYSVREKMEIPKRDYPRVLMQGREGASTVLLSIESSQIDKAKKILDGINSIILADHQKIHGAFKQNFEDMVESETLIQKRLYDKIVSSEAKMKNIEGQLASIAKIDGVTDIGKELALQNTRIDIGIIEADIDDSYLKIEESKVRVFAAKSHLINIVPTQVVEPPHSSDVPVSPLGGMNVFLAALLGFCFGLLIVFFMSKGIYN